MVLSLNIHLISEAPGYSLEPWGDNILFLILKFAFFVVYCLPVFSCCAKLFLVNCWSMYLHFWQLCLFKILLKKRVSSLIFPFLFWSSLLLVVDWNVVNLFSFVSAFCCSCYSVYRIPRPFVDAVHPAHLFFFLV